MTRAVQLNVFHLIAHDPPPMERAVVLRSPTSSDSRGSRGSRGPMLTNADSEFDRQQERLTDVLIVGAPPEFAHFLTDVAVEVAIRSARTISTMAQISSHLGEEGVGSIRFITDNTEGRKVAATVAVVAKAAGLPFEVDDTSRSRGLLERVVHRPWPGTRIARTTAQAALDGVKAIRARAPRGRDRFTTEQVILVSARNAAEHLMPIAQALWDQGAPTTVIATEAASLSAASATSPPEGRVRYAWPPLISRREARRLQSHATSAVMGIRESFGLDEATGRGLAAFVAADLVACYQRWMTVVRALDRLTLTRPAVGSTLYWASIEGRAFVGYLQRRGDATAAVSHGSLLATARRPIVDHLIVWGDEMAEAARRIWGDRPLITTAGNPHEEAVLARRPSRAGEPPMVMVAFGRPDVVLDPTDFLAALRMVIDTATKLEDQVRFVVSVHPADNSGLWPAMSESHPGAVEIMPKGAFYRFLHDSAGLVTMFSTAGSEAAFLDKPLFITSPGGSVERSQLAPSAMVEGAAYVCATREELTERIRSVVLDKDDPLASARRAHAARFLHVDPDGRSSAEVIATVLAGLATR